MNKKGILIVSFGTSHDDTRAKTIDALVQDIEENFPEYQIYTAFTSSIIRRILQKRSIMIDDVTSALEKMQADGITQVNILPTHLLFGDEYDKLVGQAMAVENRFAQLKIAKPLLACTEDIKQVIQILNEEISVEQEECVVFMGHGTEHFCNTVYAAMDYTCKAMGYEHLFVGTVEAFPALEDVLAMVQGRGYKKVVLTPLMLVAGDHAVNDMASDEEDSWKSIFQKEGFEVKTILKGLGEYPKIREQYKQHLKQLL